MAQLILYRYEGICWSAGTDEYDRPLPYRGRRSIECYEYPIIKLTPCGAWIDLDCGQKKFVNQRARKQYAWPHKAQALESFIKRKERSTSIMRARIADNEDFLKCAAKEAEYV